MKEKLKPAGTAAKELTIEVRDLDPMQMRALRKLGFDPSYISDDAYFDMDPVKRRAIDGKKTVDLTDWIMDNVYGDVDFTGVPNHKMMALCMETYQRAYGGPGEVKNS